MSDCLEEYECIHCGMLDDTRVHWKTCERHPALARVRELEARVAARDALLRDLVLRRAVHPIICPRRFDFGDSCTCSLAPWAMQEAPSND